MQMERTRNATKNIITGFILKLYQVMGPFILRTIIIYVLGIEYIGLNSLFSSILQILNLAELGVDSAMVYSMYKPIAEDNEKEICTLMYLYRFYYRIIGFVILIIGIALIPFLPNLISGDVPEGINIYILYFLNLGATVLSYWLFAYKNSLLSAHQRIDVINKVTIFITTIQYLLQIFVLLFLKSYYYYLIVALITQIIINIFIAIVTNKMYPQYIPKGPVDRNFSKQINKRIKALAASKVGEVISISSDTVIISAFLGLTVLAMYNNYYYILTAITSFITLILKSYTAGIGNSLIVETKEKNIKDLNKLTFFISWIGCFCTCCLLNLYQPFMELWVGKEYVLSFGCVICFCIYFYTRILNQTLIIYRDASGIWQKDWLRELCVAFLNLGLNILTVRWFGIYGVLLSTVISIVFIGIPWLIKILFDNVFENGNKYYIKLLVKSFLVTLICSIVSYMVCIWLTGKLVIIIIVRLGICAIISNLLYYCIFHKTKEFQEVFLMLDNIIKKILHSA